MNRLNSEVTITAPEAPVAPEVPESAYPLYIDNLIYLPFARHLAEESEDESENEEAFEAAA